MQIIPILYFLKDNRGFFLSLPMFNAYTFPLSNVSYLQLIDSR